VTLKFQASYYEGRNPTYRRANNGVSEILLANLFISEIIYGQSGRKV
jgi:hypothetical protein